MRLSPVIRTLSSPAALIYKRALAAFPIAKAPGDFLPSSPLPTLRNPCWQLVTSSQQRESAYLEWCERLQVKPAHNRKQWEWVYILQVLRQFGMLSPGKRGLGFGCGKEPLASLMASMGCTIVATDLAPHDAALSGWIAGNQHAAQLADLNTGLCDSALFSERVTFQPCDMNAISPELRGFDFLWSSCALEHLGSLEHGLRFIESAMDCLKPGGIAVHTTEFNLGSNDRTLNEGAACIYRKRDIEALRARLASAGHDVGRLNLTPGNDLPDVYVDLPPYRSPIHLRLIIKRHLSTSIGLYAIKASA